MKSEKYWYFHEPGYPRCCWIYGSSLLMSLPMEQGFSHIRIPPELYSAPICIIRQFFRDYYETITSFKWFDIINLNEDEDSGPYWWIWKWFFWLIFKTKFYFVELHYRVSSSSQHYWWIRFYCCYRFFLLEKLNKMKWKSKNAIASNVISSHILKGAPSINHPNRLKIETSGRYFMFF